MSIIDNIRIHQDFKQSGYEFKVLPDESSEKGSEKDTQISHSSWPVPWMARLTTENWGDIDEMLVQWGVASSDPWAREHVLYAIETLTGVYFMSLRGPIATADGLPAKNYSVRKNKITWILTRI